LRRDHVVGFPRVAELARAVFWVPSRNPVHLVGSDARLVLALEERQIALAEQLEPAPRDETLLDDQKAISAKAVDLRLGKLVDQERGLVLSGS
jgi:hypothetical protein